MKIEERKRTTRALYQLNGERRRSTSPICRIMLLPSPAAFRACGVDAAVMDESDEESVTIGRTVYHRQGVLSLYSHHRRHGEARAERDFDPEKSAFFMPSGSGPCRFGQYHRFHRMVLDEIGFKEVPIYAPNQDEGFIRS